MLKIISCQPVTWEYFKTSFKTSKETKICTLQMLLVENEVHVKKVGRGELF